MQTDESAERAWFVLGASLHYADGRLVTLQVHREPCGGTSSWRGCRGPSMAIRETWHTASYRDLARTSALCSTPRASRKETRQSTIWDGTGGGLQSTPTRPVVH